MSKILSATLFALLVSVMPFKAHAIPSREEVYRSDKLKTVVYRDGSDANVFWYLPPVKLYSDEATGKVVYYKKKKGTNVDFYFYVVAYMSDDLVKFLSGEIAGVVDRSQLRPMQVKKFGLQVPQYNALATSDEVTDYQYLNAPQLIKMSFSKADATEFEFFLTNLPGVQTNVVFNFTAEKQDKWLTLELTHNDVYRAMGIGGTGSYAGKYVFTKAQIDANIRKYLSNKNLNIQGKGDLPIPDIVNEVIRECFTPIYRDGNGNNNNNGGYNPYPNPYPYPGNGNGGWPGNGNNNGGGNGGVHPCDPKITPNCGPNFPINNNGTGSNTIPGNVGGGNGGINPSTTEVYHLITNELDVPADTNPNPIPNDNGTGNGNGNDPTVPPVGGNAEITFQFKMELAKSNQKFLYKDVRFSDSNEVTSVPVYLSTVATAAISQKAKALSLGSKSFVVESANSNKSNVLHTGITVQDNEQYTIDATFAISAESSYLNQRAWFKNDIAGRGVTKYLYYRVGTSQWIPVDTDKLIDGRAVVKVEMIEKGELQFYLDRAAIWGAIREDFTQPKLGGLIPSIFTYKTTYPQFNVQVSGRRFEFAK